MKKIVSHIALVALFLCTLLPAALAAEQKPEVNQAVVVIDGETVVMQLHSMGTLVPTPQGKFRQPSSSGDEYAPYPFYYCHMEYITFVQLDPRTGLELKRLDLLIPGNWETGKAYQNSEKNNLYGSPVMRYIDHQRAIYADGSHNHEGQYIAVIIDEASADFSRIKGRFEANLNSKQRADGRDPMPLRVGRVLYPFVDITVGISSFCVDKSISQPDPNPELDPFPPLAPDSSLMDEFNDI